MVADLNNEFIIEVGCSLIMTQRIDKICVLGLGYIGLPTASILATHGFEVLGVDVNPSVVETLAAGRLHIKEPGLATVVKAAVHSRQLSVVAKRRRRAQR